MFKFINLLSSLTCFLLLFITHLNYINTEYFSAVVDMAKAYELSRELLNDLNTYLSLEEKRLNQIKKYTNLIDIYTTMNNTQLYKQNTHEIERFLGNPINAYLTMRRLSTHWKYRLHELLSGKTDSNIHNVDKSFNDDLENQNFAPTATGKLLTRVEQYINLLPGDNDLDGATEAILRLQGTYKLKAEDLANGKITNDLSCPKLNAAQCLHVGKQAYESGDFVKAEEWFRAAYDRLIRELINQSNESQMKVDQNLDDLFDNSDDLDESLSDEQKPTIIQILDHIAYALGRQGRYREALNVTRKILEQDPSNTRSLENEIFYVERIRQGEGIIGPAPRNKVLSRFEEETEIYEAVCRGEPRFPPPPSASLYCRYYIPHPFYKIGPIKEEVLFPDPRIVMWYDLIHPKEIERLQELAIPRLRRATIKNPVTGNLEIAYYRTSKSAWIPYDTDEVTHRLSERIKMVTGLSLETAEDLQVGNYGLGGHYAPHFDFGRKREKDAFEIRNGNRIATIIFYLTDVDAGGATAFNRIGARVVPKKGAAGFWFNLLPSGEGDLRTRHAACPVLSGSKWVMNVWFHERGQEFIRPCELERGTIEVDDGY